MQRKMCYLCIFYFILFNVCVETTEKWLLTLKPTPFPFLILPKRARFQNLFVAAFPAMAAGLSHQLCVPAAIFSSF